MASLRNQRKKACERKKRHYTFEDADRMANWQMKFESVQELRAYKCKYCGYFHVGHKPHTVNANIPGAFRHSRT